MRIFAPLLNNLLDFASSLNFDETELRQLLDNPDKDLCQELETISEREYLLVFERVAEQSGSEALGLQMGEFFNLKALGLVLEISLNTSSIDQGIAILQGFLDSKFPIVSAETVQHGDEFKIKLTSSVSNPQLKRHLLDMVLSIIHRELQLMLPANTMTRVFLPFSKRIDYTIYFEDIKPSREHLIVLPSAITQTEINMKRIKEIEFLLPKFIAMLEEGNTRSNLFSNQVRQMILNMCAPEIPNFHQVQNQFHISDRSMQRKLTQEGTSFRQIVNGIKQELSTYLSSERHLKTKDIAHIMGYSDPSAYLHAVSAWSKK